MRVPRLLLVVSTLATAACGAGVLRHDVRVPVADGSPVAAEPPPPGPGRPPLARPVLQVIPPGADVHWGGAGGALAVTGRLCETSIVDVEQGRVTARIAACRVWPSPTRDVFLAQMDDGSVVTWDRSGARGATLAPTYPYNAAPAWSPDGTRVEELIVTRPPARDGSARGSPDGTWLAKDGGAAGTPSVDVWDVAANRRVLHLPGMVDPRWSADSRYLSVRSEEPRLRGLAVFAAGSWRDVWRRPDSARGTWSTAGARLAVTSDAGGMEVLDATTGRTHPLPGTTTAWFERLYQAPDGALMAPLVPDADGRWRALRVAHGEPASVVELPAEALQPGWSPDGSRRATHVNVSPNMMMASWRLFVDDRTTGEHTFVDHGYGGVDAQWSSRRHRLLVVHRGVLFFDADTHRVWPVAVEPPSAWALDADGARAALETSEGLQLVKLGSKEPPVMLSPPAHPLPALLALSGSRLAAVTRDGEVTVWNVDGHTAPVSWSAGFKPEYVAWVGEGERLALSRREALHLSNADGSNAVTLTALRRGEATSVLSVP